jgi:S-adenosylmethionine-dependent methyltransferase
MAAHADNERFRQGAEKYAAYLTTPEGRLRLDLAFANLQEFLPKSSGQVRALDLGGGTGALAIRLARLGIRVTLLDSSQPMLDLARHAAREAGVTDHVAMKYGDAAELRTLLDTASFDVILCHNVLEYVSTPGNVLREVSRALRDCSSVVSILVRNQAGEVLRAAIQSGDLLQAEHNLTAKCGHESLYDGPVRLFTAESLQTMLRTAALSVTAKRGVRVVSDYLPPVVSRSAEYDRIFQLERRLGSRQEFVGVARYTQWFAHRATENA